MESTQADMLEITFRPLHHAHPPAHHVMPQSIFPTLSSLASYITKEPEPAPPPKPIGFCNPWPSFRKRTIWDYAAPLRWDRPTEPAGPHEGPGPGDGPENIDAPEQKREHEMLQREEQDEQRQQRRRIREMLPMPRLSRTSSKLSRVGSVQSQPEEVDEDDLDLQIKVVDPDFGGLWEVREARATWLGHAGVMLQLPSLRTEATAQNRPLRILFDPIFSMRCSPSQYVGPYRYAPPPCSVADLPEIDIVLISHNHYDHLDTDTILQLYQFHGANLHFFVPLGVRDWFVSSSIPAAQVTEMDWWDEADATYSPTAESSKEPLVAIDDDAKTSSEGARIRITCAPAQHGSNRYGYDGDTTLWCSWYIEHITPSSRSSSEKTFRAFFAGDTGLRWTDDGETVVPSPAPTRRSTLRRFSSPSTPTRASPLRRISSLSSGMFTMSPTSSPTDTVPPSLPVPICPAFEEVCRRIGPPHLSFLPISVGASLSFLRSYSPFPAGLPPVHLSKSFTSAIHMTPADAVEVHRILERIAKEARTNNDGATKEEAKTNHDRLIDDNASTLALPPSPPSKASSLHTPASSSGPISLGIHFGTWCSGEQEVRGVVRDLRKSCAEQAVKFGRTLPLGVDADADVVVQPDGEMEDDGRFIVINHGETISLRF